MICCLLCRYHPTPNRRYANSDWPRYISDSEIPTVKHYLFVGEGVDVCRVTVVETPCVQNPRVLKNLRCLGVCTGGATGRGRRWKRLYSILCYKRLDYNIYMNGMFGISAAHLQMATRIVFEFRTQFRRALERCIREDVLI